MVIVVAVVVIVIVVGVAVVVIVVVVVGPRRVEGRGLFCRNSFNNVLISVTVSLARSSTHRVHGDVERLVWGWGGGTEAFW